MWSRTIAFVATTLWIGGLALGSLFTGNIRRNEADASLRAAGELGRGSQAGERVDRQNGGAVTLFIVASGTAAQQVEGAMNEAGTIRQLLREEPPLRYWVSIVSGDAQAALLTSQIDEGNRILQDIDQPQVDIVDLRSAT